MYYLEQKEIQVTKGILDYPKLKQRFEYHLTEKDRKKLQSYMENIKEIVRRKTAPKVISQSICKSCAYYEYCYV